MQGACICVCEHVHVRTRMCGCGVCVCIYVHVGARCLDNVTEEELHMNLTQRIKPNKKTVFQMYHMAKSMLVLKHSSRLSSLGQGIRLKLCTQSLEVLRGCGYQFLPRVVMSTRSMLPTGSMTGPIQDSVLFRCYNLIPFEFPLSSCLLYVVHSVRR